MAGVYLSYPFCSQKCTYCNFASGVFPAELERRYGAALRTELKAAEWEWTPETLYIGGGSPSRWDTEDLGATLACVPGREWKEATIEAAPGDVSEERLRAWLAAGLNRVSFGVQSFVKRELAQTGRRHTAETVAGEVAMLREAGLGNINLDLIAGLPHQTVATFAESLEWIVRLDVPHVSVYMLEVDEDSRLGLEILQEGSRYGAGQRATEEAVVEMYELAMERLREAGLERYEISNFARAGYESPHNLKYWRLAPYAGFGADAHSFDGRRRKQNVESTAEYVALMETGGNGVAECVAANLEEERFLVGLRLAEGIGLSAAEYGAHRGAIERFVGDGLLRWEGGMLSLTRQGVLYSNDVIQEFLHS
ncbi:MAG: radical SAM family heme chaperone HemW [Bryobacterales bacterium]|nr:radical SAM family heme chaperone HemW [Bryobacterales bacterium]